MIQPLYFDNVFFFCSGYDSCPSERKSESSDEPRHKRVSFKHKPSKSKLNGLIQSMEEAKPRRPATKSPEAIPSLARSNDTPPLQPPRTPSPAHEQVYQPKMSPVSPPSKMGVLSDTTRQASDSGLVKMCVLPPDGVPPAPSSSSQQCDSSSSNTCIRWVKYNL